MNPPDEVNPNFGFRVKTSQTLMSRSIEIETSRFSKDERPKTTRWCVKSVWFSQKISPVNFPAVSDGKRQIIMSPPLPDEMNSESSSPGARETQVRCESSDDLRNYLFQFFCRNISKAFKISIFIKKLHVVIQNKITQMIISRTFSICIPTLLAALSIVRILIGQHSRL